MKTCSRCKNIKNIEDFGKDTHNKDGLTNACKICRALATKKYNENNIEKVKALAIVYRKTSYLKNQEKVKKQTRQYYKSNREKCIEYQKEYRKNNPEKCKNLKRSTPEKRKINNALRRAKYAENPTHYMNLNKKYNENNKELVAYKKKIYEYKNKERLKLKRLMYHRHRYKTDILYRLKRSITRRLTFFLSKNKIKKTRSSSKYLGVEITIIKKHIELQFTKGMSWENYGEWHIDHVIPLSSAKNENEIYELAHYRNLQPLWAFANRIKSDKVPNIQVSLCI